MVKVAISLLLSLISSVAFAEDAEKAPCADRVEAIRKAEAVDRKPDELRASARKATERAQELTEAEGISAEVVISKLVLVDGKYGFHVRVADDVDAGQANAYEFDFDLDKDSVRLLAKFDDWHTHGDYKTVYVCEK